MSEALDNARAALSEEGFFSREQRAVIEPLIAEHERLTAPPTDDEREELVDIEITHRPTSWNGGSGCTCGIANPGLTMHLQQWHRAHLMDVILAAGFRRQGPVTDADLGIMAQRFYEVANESPDITFHSMTVKPVIVGALRAALEAARG